MMCKLSEICEFNPREYIPKGRIAKKVPMDALRPFCRDIPAFSLEPYNGGTKFRNGDTLMARITPCLENGKTAKVKFLNDDEVGFGSTEYIVLRAIKGVCDPDFLFYLVRSPSVRAPAIKSMVGTSGRQRVQTDVLEQLVLDIPPLPVQQKIGGLLKSLDDKIELNLAINRNLGEQAKATYKSWFIDFEPFRRERPLNWMQGKAGEIMKLHDSLRVPLSGREREKMEKIYPYYGAASIIDYVDNYTFDGIYLLLAEDGTVIDTQGFPVLQYVDGKFWVNNHTHVLTGKKGFSVEILYLLFSYTNVQPLVTGAVQPKINQANLRDLPVLIPDEDALRKFDAIIQPLFAKIRECRKECNALAALRDTLLPRLMSGELDVSELNI